jgi:putative membrane protein
MDNLQNKIPDKALEKKMNIASVVISVAVLSLVVLMRRIKIDIGVDLSFLPMVHAILNSLTAIALVYALIQIKQKNVAAHRAAIYTALTLSATFLLCYVLYHFTTPETKFGGEGTIRSVYFFLLATHIILAAGILPFILLTFTRAFTGQFSRHKKMARWVFPLWLYVAITGPVCYLMLLPYYK